MNEFKVTFSDGDFIYTRMNATLEESERYYIGNIFNLGTVEDRLVKGIKVEKLN